MKSCAYCGRVNQDEARHCRECGTDFAIPHPLPEPVPQKAEGTPKAVEPECDEPPEGEAALCTGCLFPNHPDSRWCKRCGAPLSSNAMIVMPDAAWAVGFVYRRAVETPPTLVVVLGIWIHFFPGFFASALVLLTMGNGGMEGGEGLLVLLLTIGVGIVCASMLYRVTRNYFTMPRRPPVETAA